MGLFQGRGQVAMPDPMALLAIVLCLVILSLTVSIPLVMTLWFAPALVVLHDVSAVRAMVLSFRGCLANLMPFLLYGLAVIGLAIVATIPFGLGWLVLAPVLVTSTYTACQEIFAPRG
jgi:uncharacterized membrane protein